jgi:TrmH family RNA methyltransferase
LSEITSVRSAPVLAAAKLAKRTFRGQERKFLAEGPQAVGEALARPDTVTALFVTAEARARHRDLIDEAGRTGLTVHQVSGQVMGTLCGTITPQGMVAVCRFLDVSAGSLVGVRGRLAVVLAQVRDPGNAGTVIRTADAAGADGVVFTRGCVDIYNGKCVRATAGSLFHLPIAVDAELAATIEALRAAGSRVLAADGRGAIDLDDLCDSGALAAPTAWLFGNEAWGLPPEIAALADEVVRVPIHGSAESLNLAGAAAVCLYASARAQRRTAGARSDPAPRPGP